VLSVWYCWRTRKKCTVEGSDLIVSCVHCDSDSYMSHQCSELKEVKKVATKKKQQSYAAAVKGYSKRSLVKKPTPEKLSTNSVDLRKLITTVVTVLIESLKSTPEENLSTQDVVDVVYQKLQDGSTVENANEPIQEERKHALHFETVSMLISRYFPSKRWSQTRQMNILVH